MSEEKDRKQEEFNNAQSRRDSILQTTVTLLLTAYFAFKSHGSSVEVIFSKCVITLGLFTLFVQILGFHFSVDSKFYKSKLKEKEVEDDGKYYKLTTALQKYTALNQLAEWTNSISVVLVLIIIFTTIIAIWIFSLGGD